MTSEHISEERVLFVSALAADDAEKIAALGHAAGCAECARLLEQGAAMLRMLDSVESAVAVPRALEARVLDAVRAAPVEAAPVSALREKVLWWLLALFSAGLIWFDGKPNRPLEPALGLHCMRYELGFALLSFAITVVWMRSTARPIGALRGAVAAMTGAVVGQTLLRVRCEAADAALHMLVFHGLGVLVASALGAVAAMGLRRAGFSRAR